MRFRSAPVLGRSNVGNIAVADFSGTLEMFTLLASVVSLFITAKVDLPIGAAIVCVLGIALILAALAAKILNRNSKPLLERSGVS